MALHEGGIRTPLLVRHPAAPPPSGGGGRVTPVQTTFYDIFPTFAAIAGAPVERGVYDALGLDGRSVLPTILGPAGSQPVAPPFLYTEYRLPHDPLDGSQCRGLKPDYPIAQWGCAVRMGNWSAVCLGATPSGGHVPCDGALFLYELGRDPGQTTDVAAAHPDVIVAMRKIMDAQHVASPSTSSSSSELAIASAPEIYVAAEGSPCSDAGPGTEAAPLCSLHAAAAAARTRHTGGARATVVLRGGVHRLNRTLALGAADSDTMWAAYPGEKPVVSGGVRLVSTWQRASAPPGAWVAAIPAAAVAAGVLDARQIYVDGARAFRPTGNASELLGAMVLDRSASAYAVSRPGLKGWRNPADLELVYEAQIRPWTAPRCSVTGVSADGLTLGLAPACARGLPAPSGASKVRWFLSGLPSSVENAFELLLLNASSPGTFYIDRAAAEVYYIPRPGDDMGAAPEVVFPVLESLVVARGVSGLSISGISFEHTNWMHPLGTYIPVQAGCHGGSTHSCAPIPGGVRFANCTNLAVSRCAFRRMGGAGVDVYNGSQHATIQGAFVSDISGSGVQVGGVAPCPNCPGCAARGEPCPTAVSPAMDYNVSVRDTVVVNATQEYHGCLGVWGGYMRQFHFEHNDICRVAYGGLSLGWGWAIPVAQTYQRENDIGYNRISHWLRVLEDSGGTYTLGPHPASSVHHNHAFVGGSGVEPGPEGLPNGGVHGGAYYADDGSAFWDIHDNVASDVNYWCFLWNAKDESNVTVRGNFADTPRYEMNAVHSNFSDNTFVNRSAGEAWPAAARAIIAGAGVRAANAHPDYTRTICD